MDQLITRQDVPERLQALVAHAYERAPAIRNLFDRNGIRPTDIESPADLSSIPVTSKEELLDMQRRDPPFGGLLGVDMRDVQRVFVSPGPIYEPDAGNRPGHGFDAAMVAAGIRQDDIVLNTWSYHLVPAGLLLDEAFRRSGAAVVPGGVGNTETQARVVVELGVTVIAASTAFFQALVDCLEGSGHELPRDWRLRAAYLGGEFGNWAAKRRALEQRYGIQTFSVYGTGDLGLVGYECSQQDGYHVAPDVIVQICDPSTGEPLPDDHPGEVVATSLDPAWPLIRFGTGDVTMVVSGLCACGDAATKLAPLLGRTSQSVKVREIFVYPRHMDDVRAAVDGVERVQGTVSRRDGRDELDLDVEVDEGHDWTEVEAAVHRACTAVTRLRPGKVRAVPPGALAADAPLLRNERDK